MARLDKTVLSGDCLKVKISKSIYIHINYIFLLNVGFSDVIMGCKLVTFTTRAEERKYGFDREKQGAYGPVLELLY